MPFIVARRSPESREVEYAKGRSHSTMGWTPELEKARVFLRKHDASGSYAMMAKGNPQVLQVSLEIKGKYDV